MSETMVEVLRRWSILIVGLVLLLGGFALGTVWYPPGGTAPTTQTAGSEKPAEPQQQMAHNAAPKPPAAPEKIAAEPQQRRHPRRPKHKSPPRRKKRGLQRRKRRNRPRPATIT